MAKLLIDAKAHVNARNKRDVTPLIVAAVKGHISVLRLLVAHPEIHLSDQVGPVCSVWQMICNYGDEYLLVNLLLLVSHAVCLHVLLSSLPLTLLPFCVPTVFTSYTLPIVCGALQDSDGDTALHCAVMAQKNESVSVLLEAGADPTLVNFQLFTPIHEAARIGFQPYVKCIASDLSGGGGREREFGRYKFQFYAQNIVN